MHYAGVDVPIGKSIRPFAMNFMNSWSEQDTKLLIDLYNMWSPLSNIAHMMKRSKNSIIGKIDRLRRDPILCKMLIRPADLTKSHRKHA